MKYLLRRSVKFSLLLSLNKLSNRFLTNNNLTKSKNLQKKLIKRRWKSLRKNMIKKK